MVWKFPSRFPPVLAEDINPEAMQEVSKDELKSTYQSDYTGIPQGKAKMFNKHCSVVAVWLPGGNCIYFWILNFWY